MGSGSCLVFVDPKNITIGEQSTEAFNFLTTMFLRWLHFCISGDTNDLKLNLILNISSNLVQQNLQNLQTIDPVMMTLSQYYQEPLCLDPLGPDPDKDGKMVKMVRSPTIG